MNIYELDKILIQSFQLVLLILLLFLAFVYFKVFIRKNFYLKDSGKIIFKSSIFYKNLVIPSLIVLITWVARGIIISGCIAYPSKLGYFKNLQWSANTGVDLKYIISWARGGLHASPNEVLGNWNWFNPWVARFVKSGDKIIPIAVIVGLLLLITAVIRKNFSNSNKYYSPFFVPLIISFSGIAFWFFTAPEPRYGYGFLFGFALLIFSYGLYVFKLPKYEEISKLAVVFVIVLFFLVEIVPLNVSINKVFTDNWGKLPKVEVKEEITKEGIKINSTAEGDQCWYTELPATPYFNPDLKITFLGNGKYIMFYYPD